MSYYANDLYLEQKHDTFELAIENEEWEEANKVIAELFDNGFDTVAVQLGKELLNRKMSVREYDPVAKFDEERERDTIDHDNYLREIAENY